MSNLTANGRRKPLAYHWPVDAKRGAAPGICGSHGMTAGSVDTVTCIKCRRSPRFPKLTYPLYGARP